MNSPYTPAELQRIEASGIPIFGDLHSHPVLQLSDRRYRPIFFEEDITKLNIEASDNRCNLRCVFCYQSDLYHNTRRQEKYMRMPVEKSKQIIDALPNMKVFVPYSINEPGMVPSNMEQILAYVWEKRQAKVFISSNLSLPWKNFETWVGTPGIEKIILGAGGISKETHEHHRPGSKWEIFTANIERLVRLREQTGYPRNIEYQVIITNQNEHEVDRIDGFARDMGLQSVQYKSLALKTEASKSLLPQDASFVQDTSVWMDSPCAYMFEALTVVLSNHNGLSDPGPKVAMCVCGYFDPPHDQEYIRGDLTTQDLFTAMNDPVLQRLRFTQLTQGMGAIPQCRDVCDCQKPLTEQYIRGGMLKMSELLPVSAIQ